MKFEITKEEKEAIEKYQKGDCQRIEELLTEQIENDLLFLAQKDERAYSKEDLVQMIEKVKLLDTALLKKFRFSKEERISKVYQQMPFSEWERLRNELYLNPFLLTSTEKEGMATEFSKTWMKTVTVEMEIEDRVPYMELEKPQVLVAPFTKVVELEETTEKICHVKLERQEWENLSEEENANLYETILEQADEMSKKMKTCIALDEENAGHYESIRKLEQLLAKHNFAMEQENYEQDTTEEERKSDLEDVERITEELNSLKATAAEIFNQRQENTMSILEWKKDVIIYLKDECRKIHEKYELEDELEEPLEDIEVVLEGEEKKEQKKKELPPECMTIQTEVVESKAVVETLLKNIKDLIAKQQNHARIAEAMDSNYKALNNAFEMKNCAEELEALVQAVFNKMDSLSPENKEEWEKISETNLQVSILLNYLNNAKAGVGKKITRFDEMGIIEENELKREIAETIKNIRCEAELKKLRDDVEIIEDKTTFQKLIGRLTGRNKLDETMLEQIQIRQTAIKKTFRTKMLLSYNYSIHELIAEIEMFIQENEEDELVAEEVSALRKMKEILKKNFVIMDSKVSSLVDQKTGKNLPVTDRKLSKKELIEIDTYRFLNRYGYDRANDKKEPEYQDTVASEIKRIVDYIKTSGVI